MGAQGERPDRSFDPSPERAVHIEWGLAALEQARSRGDGIVVVDLPSPSPLTASAGSAAFAVVAGLRNGAAVGCFVASALRIGMVDRVTIVLAGERARFAIEDWLPAGAVAFQCRACGATLSSEAEVAARAFDASRRDLQAGVDDVVAWLHGDGFVKRLPFTLRPATRHDRSFLFALKKATMLDYIVATFGRWDDRVERRRFAPDLTRIAVVAVDGSDVGMVEARADGDDFYLANLQLTPQLQGGGLGAQIVDLLAATAHARGRALVLRVLKVNVRARRFYERVGLHVTGELEHHFSMSLPAPASS